MSDYKFVVLDGPYLKGARCRVFLDEDKKIVDSDLVHCVWSGTPRYDQWFRDQYMRPPEVEEQWQSITLPSDELVLAA